jgi:peptidoglycan/LPS O-acetylase OafA/YrhL
MVMSALAPSPVRERVCAPAFRGHLPALDGLRGVAILLVMMHHFIVESRNPISQLAHHGWMGVDLFFVLSGFLITGILVDAREAPRYFRNFFARRALRILPLYFVAVTIYLGVDALWPGAGSSSGGVAPWLLTHTMNFKFAMDGWRPFSGTVLSVATFWSLAIEEQFYLVWPFLVRWLSHRRVVVVCVALVISALVARLVLVNNGAGADYAYALTPCRVDALCVGGLIAVGLRTERGQRLILELYRPVGAVAASAVIAAAVAAMHSAAAASAFVVFGYTLLALAFGALLVQTLVAAPESRLARILSSQALGVVGRYSYGLYVWHLFLLPLYNRVFPFNEFAERVGSWSVALLLYAIPPALVAAALAWVSYHVLEERFLRLKKLFAAPTRAPQP